MPTKKVKLRTARDVISRLRWSDDDLIESGDPRQQNVGGESTTTVLMGYMDRIEGPMEKNVKDYVAADSGGDIPEHRILYFRRHRATGVEDRDILWDRVGRVDKIFGSGNGNEAPVANETKEAVTQAMQNMLRIE